METELIHPSGRKMELRRNAPVVSRKTCLIIQHVCHRTVEKFPCASAIVVNKCPSGKVVFGVEGLSEHHISVTGTRTARSQRQKSRKQMPFNEIMWIYVHFCFDFKELTLQNYINTIFQCTIITTALPLHFYSEPTISLRKS